MPRDPASVPGPDPPPEGLRVLALIPAYDAADTVGAVVRGVREHLPVLVVDDGSADGTAEAARSAGAEVHRLEANRGKGAALKAGFREALDRPVDAVLTLDADGQHDPADIPAFLTAWHRAAPDLVIGARDFSEMPFTRRLANTIGRWSLSWAMGRRIPDNQSGYRLVGRRLAREMLDSGETGFEFEVEMLLTCLRRGWVVEWVPIRTIYDEQESHISPVEHIVGFFRMVARARKAVRSGPGRGSGGRR